MKNITGKKRKKTLIEIEEEFKKAEKKRRERLNELRTGCKHSNTDRWSDYEGINEQCLDCGHWVR